MKHGIHFPDFQFAGGTAAIAPMLAATAQAAEEGGASLFTLMDHYFQMEARAPATDNMLEGYTALGFVAAKTSTIPLGLLVTGVTYRHPGLLAKIVTTLDVLSGGRAVLGLGAAWYEREHRALGVPYPAIAERFERLEETLQICLQMWSDDDGPYAGTHYALAETICEPKPLSQPHPRILIGGGGEKKTLRLVAQYADACNLFGTDADTIAHKLEVLAGHCADLGRDPAEIEKTAMFGADPLDDVDAFLRAMETFGSLGIQTVTMSPHGTDPAAWVSALNEQVVPRLREV